MTSWRYAVLECVADRKLANAALRGDRDTAYRRAVEIRNLIGSQDRQAARLANRLMRRICA